MKTLLIVIIVGLLIFYIFRPTTRKRIKKNYEDNDNWSNMGFFKIAATFSDGELSVINWSSTSWVSTMVSRHFF